MMIAYIYIDFSESQADSLVQMTKGVFGIDLEAKITKIIEVLLLTFKWF